MNPKANPLVLAMFTFMCATLPAAGVIPSVIAQGADSTSLDEEDLASSIVSDVLHGGGDDDEEEVNDDATPDDVIDEDSTDTATVNPNQEDQTIDQDDDTVTFGDDTNTQTAIPIIEQDQRAANLAEQLAANLDINLILSSIPANPTIPECPPGFTLNDNGQCERTVTQDPECPIGFTFNPETDQCESSTALICEPGEFNSETDKCESDPDCTVGTFNSATDQCESDPECTAGEFNSETDLCVESTAPICTVGTFNSATDKCEQRQTQAPT